MLASGADVDRISAAIAQAGGHVTHVFPSIALIGQVPIEMPPLSGILAIQRASVDTTTMTTLDSRARRAAQVWNALLASRASPDTVQSLGNLEAELVDDALVAPGLEELQLLDNDPSPGYYQTSEFLIGRVAVGIILPESDGSLDPSTENWDEAERLLVLVEITAALNWWAAREPRAHLTFVYDDGTMTPTATSYEPISRGYGDQSLWITEVMTKKGYTGSSYFDQVRRYDNALRETLDTDWAFTVFVVDSSNDDDNRFADGYFAYAYVGGPFMVMTYGNNGYGPTNLDAVAAHETGHIFLALDQYYSARQPCTRQSGYLGVENQNSQYGQCASNAPSIMRGQVGPYYAEAVDAYAREQLGWRDTDADGILDPVDTSLRVLAGNYTPHPDQPNVLTFAGYVQDDPYPSPLRRSTLINTIQQVQYRIDGGAWRDAQPIDGAFDTYLEAFTFTTPPLPTGNLLVDLHVSDSAGNKLIHTLDSVSIIDPVDTILDTTLTRLGQQSEGGKVTRITYSGRAISSTSFVAGVYYRVDDYSWQPLAAEDGAFDEPQEDLVFDVDLKAIGAGIHQVQAYAMDGDGNVETSPASDSIVVEEDTRYLFFPMVIVSP